MNLIETFQNLVAQPMVVVDLCRDQPCVWKNCPAVFVQQAADVVQVTVRDDVGTQLMLDLL